MPSRRVKLTAKFVKSRVYWYARRLGFKDWHIDVYLCTIESGDEADCEATPEYKEAILRFDLSSITSLRRLDHLIVHELGHLHTWSLSEIAESLAGGDEFKLGEIAKALESATTHWDRVIVRLLQGPRRKLDISRARRAKRARRQKDQLEQSKTDNNSTTAL